ncbi:MAG: enoyl-CoA hydratase/isomerase family protein [Deltaproteobacteria bacterium]|nr:enoyl-CoA hydratase/isomerase family protein [Deltaproteobacteria bacterium]
MQQVKKIYPSFFNPFLIETNKPLPEEMAVIGAGTIGPDIAYYLKSGLPDKKLFLVDVDEEPLKKAEKRFQGYAQKAIARKKMKEEQAQAVLENITYTTNYEEISNCDLVIEAATENLDLKKKIFEMVEGIVREDTIITSNTSSIPADRIFTNMQHPERATVTHFFAPAWRSLGVEVINWEGASQETIDYMFWFFAQTGKAPVITDNAICFMLNSIFENWVNEAAHLLNVGNAAQVDAVAQEFVLGGPFFVVNMGNGNPIVYETNTRKMEEGKCYRPSPLFLSVEKWNVPPPGTPVEVPEGIKGHIRDRMLGIVFSQSFDITDRGIGTKEDLNLGSQVALGFRKGLFDIMRDLGDKEVERIMERYEKERPGFPQPQQPVAEYQKFHRHLLVDEMDGVKIITIRRPQAMNALSDEIMNEVAAVLEEYADDAAVKGFVLTGYGTRAFSAGADIGRFPETLGNKEAAAQSAREGAVLLDCIGSMDKPVVAAVNGMALGGGLELAMRCHSMVATKNAVFQFPEITLGILPGIGGCVFPYRKWPKGAALFNEMICLAKRINAQEAADIGMVAQVSDTYLEMIRTAVEEVSRLVGKVTGIPEGPVDLPVFQIPEEPKAGKLALSKEAVSIAFKTVQSAAAAESLSEALEINYQGSGEIACTEAAKEGITAFLQKRKPEFKK